MSIETSIENRERPAGLWAIAIIAILLGALGSCGGTLGLLAIATQDQLVEMQRNLEDQQPNDAIREINRDLQERTLEINRAWRIPSTIGNIANLLASFALIIAAILLLRWHPNAAAIFIGAVVFSIVADLVVGGVSAIVQQQTMGAMESFGQRLGEASGDASAERVVSGAMRAGGTVGLCFALGWLIAKLSFYISALVYLRREAVRVLFR